MGAANFRANNAAVSNNAARSNFSASSGNRFAANNWNGRRDHHHGGRGFGRGFGAGFFAGAAIGSAPYYYGDNYAYGDGYYGDGYAYGGDYDDSYAAVPAYSGGDDAAYCAQQYRSYDPASGTYLGYDGERHPCP
jgi:hypothetical protein